ncbi:MAG: hypothetical protein Alpg2KO_01470 [Alphaproteobacteria bacterium]
MTGPDQPDPDAAGLRAYSSPVSMMQDIGAWLEKAPIDRTIMLGALGGSTGFADGDIAAVLTDPDTGRIRAACLREGKVWPMSIAAETAEDAAHLARHVAQGIKAGLYTAVDRLVGPLPLATAGADALFGQSMWQEEHRLLCYRLADDAVPPELPDGFGLRWAEQDDRDLVIDWSIGFGSDTGLPPQEWERSHVESRAHKRLTGDNLLFLLDASGAPLSMAGHSRCGQSLARIGGVYTPADLRGKGYAALTVAHLCDALRKRGLAEICLYADAANPTSNALYQRIGFALHDQHCTVKRLP